MWHYMWGGTEGWFFGLMHLAWWALLIAAAVVLFRFLLTDRRMADRSLEILRERYARGEIDQHEYDERLRHLGGRQDMRHVDPT